MNKPTGQQVKEFWEWCGIKQYKASGEYDDWIFSDGRLSWEEFKRKPIIPCPPIDLNNLFKYAVPKVEGGIGGASRAIFLVRWIMDTFMDSDKDPALALFWALWQVKARRSQ